MVFGAIPSDTNILITHSPPKGILDFDESTGEHLGSWYLKERVEELENLKAHIFGHIHEPFERNEGVFYNVSMTNNKHEYIHSPTIIHI